MLRARLATAAVAIPALLALIFLAPAWAWGVLVVAVAGLGLLEYLWLAFPERIPERGLGLLLGSVLIAAAISTPVPGVRVVAAISLLLAAGLMYLVVLRPDIERSLTDLGLLVIGVLYVGLLLPHFYWLHNLPAGPQWVTFVIAVGMGGDSGGYFVGHAYGRHKLIPRVSPGKTVEGAAGIVFFSMLVGALAKVILLPERHWGEMMVLAFVMAVVGQLGDLGESIMKRTFGAKESGWIFPGHGGVLDRIDSLLFPVTVVYYYVAW